MNPNPQDFDKHGLGRDLPTARLPPEGTIVRYDSIGHCGQVARPQSTATPEGERLAEVRYDLVRMWIHNGSIL